jgi:hypothetical protein
LSVTGTPGALLGGTNSTIALNLANANTWAALQTFANASSTLFSSTYASSTQGYFGTLNIPSITSSLLSTDSTGKVVSTSTIPASFITGGALGVANGGTGTTTIGSSRLLYGNGTSALQSVATSSLGGSASITVTGSIGAAVGGTGANFSLNLANANSWSALQTFANASSTLLSSSYASSTNAYFGTAHLPLITNALLSTDANGTVLATSSINIAQYLNGSFGVSLGGTGVTTYATGDILYADAPDHLTTLPVGSNGTVLKLAGGVPTWGTDLTSGGGGGAGAWATTSDSLAIYPTDTSNVVIVGSNATSSLVSIFEVHGKSYFSNFVGIGTTSPFATLSVAGSIFANDAITGSNITATGTLKLPALTSSLLSTNSSGTVVGTSTVPASFITGGALGIANGGTGTSTAPSYGQLLLGNNAGGYDLVATSSLGIQAGVTSVSNSDGSLTVSPTTGDVIASLNLGNANTWTAL